MPATVYDDTFDLAGPSSAMAKSDEPYPHDDYDTMDVEGAFASPQTTTVSSGLTKVRRTMADYKKRKQKGRGRGEKKTGGAGRSCVSAGIRVNNETVQGEMQMAKQIP